MSEPATLQEQAPVVEQDFPAVPVHVMQPATFPPASNPVQIPIAPAKGKGRHGNGVPFTSETAKAASKRAAELARQRKADAEEIARQVALAPEKLAAERAELCSEQIKRTRDVLNGELEPKERAQLLASLDRLLERERILRGIPGPGNFRPSRSRQPAQPPASFEE